MFRVLRCRKELRFFSQLNVAAKESEALQCLREVIEPITSKKLTAVGCLNRIFVDKNDKVIIDLDLVVPGYTYQNQLIDQCKTSLKHLPWVKDISVNVIPPRMYNEGVDKDSNLSSITHVIGVSSCKGGVGKSTVAVNFACALAQLGLRVGIFDADIYGPSLPLQLPAAETIIRKSKLNPKFVEPLVSKHLPNLKMLSFGHVNANSGAPGAGGQGAALMRGPMATKVINQLLLGTEWGPLDYLVVDMPPGTGDIQLTLSQSAQFSGAVIVTTPHKLALVDAAKGVAMFDAVNIPTLALVENMAYFTCEHGKKYYPFGKGGKTTLLKALIGKTPQNINNANKKKPACGGSGDNHNHDHDHEHSSIKEEETDELMQHHKIAACPYFSLPLSIEGAGMTNSSSSNGSNSSTAEHNCSHHHADEEEDAACPQSLEAPLVLTCPTSESATIYKQLAKGVIEQLFVSQIEVNLIPSIVLDKTQNLLKLRYFTNSGAFEYSLSSLQLRSRDAKTGAKLSSSLAAADMPIESIDFKGTYGVGIKWKDRVDIYPYDILKLIVEELQTPS